ncbi:hypothetical protein [Glaciimonas sp. PAMC28666]|uniref:hypothetical protein n=1 Tax=Glaciimonas sp. PAMC28666 TaxID=2807626 RepID=UPI0019658621|nr:hypothetical protein [Glaciimonas sp. PAMC28666]QRX84641.1 hypothetical protein JQN73_10945 [Glaciimonas sp. PAMC28666]
MPLFFLWRSTARLMPCIGEYKKRSHGAENYRNAPLCRHLYLRKRRIGGTIKSTHQGLNKNYKCGSKNAVV